MPLATISTQAGQSTTRIFCLDGNRNVVALVDAATALPVAHYDYSPFGLPVAAVGPAAQDNHLRFSSEAFDPETGLVYYNYRYYSPELGRWLSRDPFGEQGGANLYAMLGNEAIQNVDRLGLFKEGRRRYRLRAQREGLFMHIARMDCPGCPICTYTGIPHRVDLYDQLRFMGGALEALVDAFPLGHSDFTGDIHGPDGIFDYNIEDDSFHTHPATPWGINGHFKERSKVEKLLQLVIDGRAGSPWVKMLTLGQIGKPICPCDNKRFERLMHRLQDTYVHYDGGYRGHWLGFNPVSFLVSITPFRGHGLGHMNSFWGVRWNPDPDDDEGAWNRAEERTIGWKEKWDTACVFRNGAWQARNAP